VTTGSGDLQGSFGRFLSADVGEVERVGTCRRGWLGWCRRDQGIDTDQMLDGLGEAGQSVDRDDLESRGFGGIGRR
jgi:hypothetical protein